jgi:hypothetical protein
MRAGCAGVAAGGEHFGQAVDFGFRALLRYGSEKAVVKLGIPLTEWYTCQIAGIERLG